MKHHVIVRWPGLLFIGIYLGIVPGKAVGRVIERVAKERLSPYDAWQQTPFHLSIGVRRAWYFPMSPDAREVGQGASVIGATAVDFTGDWRLQGKFGLATSLSYNIFNAEDPLSNKQAQQGFYVQLTLGPSWQPLPHLRLSCQLGASRGVVGLARWNDAYFRTILNNDASLDGIQIVGNRNTRGDTLSIPVVGAVMLGEARYLYPLNGLFATGPSFVFSLNYLRARPVFELSRDTPPELQSPPPAADFGTAVDTYQVERVLHLWHYHIGIGWVLAWR